MEFKFNHVILQTFLKDSSLLSEIVGTGYEDGKSISDQMKGVFFIQLNQFHNTYLIQFKTTYRRIGTLSINM